MINIDVECARCGDHREYLARRYGPRRPPGWVRLAMDGEPMRLLCDSCTRALQAFFTVELQEHAHG